MAKRLATEYVQTRLQLSEPELMQFVQTWSEQQVTSKVRVLDNGTQEVVFVDKTTGEEVFVTFERKLSYFEMSKSLRVNSPKVADLLRKAVIRYKGDAVVKRIYVGFTMVYSYEKGSVVKIVECAKGKLNTIFEQDHALERLENMYQAKNVELQIEDIRKQVDRLLDQRNQCSILHEDKIRALDMQLSALSQQLFVLEA